MNILFHKCNSECPPEHSQSQGKPINCENRGLAIDFHCHILSPAVEKIVADCPQKKGEPELLRRMMGEESVVHNVKEMLPTAFRKMCSMEERLSDMDAMGVDIQVLSPSPSQYYYWADPDLARQIARSQNEEIAVTCADRSERFVGLGNVSLQHEGLAVERPISMDLICTIRSLKNSGQKPKSYRRSSLFIRSARRLAKGSINFI
jgi:aminocarboxymuconate-semialdehyde decarboxylase